MKNLLKILTIIYTFAFILQTNALEEIPTNTGNGLTPNIQRIDYELNIDKEITSFLKNEVSVNAEYNINLTELEERLKIIFPEKNFRATWDIKGASSQDGFEIKRIFREKGEKEIELNIYESTEKTNENNNTFIEEKVFYTKNFKVLVFEKIMPIIFSDSIAEEDLNSYIEYSKQDGIYVYKIGPLNKTDIELTSIMTILNNYNVIGGLKADYLTVWGGRDFIFNVLSKINSEIATLGNNDTKINIVSISSYNLNILENYLKNFLSNKNWVNKIILLNENSKFFILKHTQIEELVKGLNDNRLQYIDINIANTGINKILFISNFVNNLSNLGYSTETIYIFLLIPLIFTIISFFKHFIGLSPIGIVIPVFLTELFFKLGVIQTLVLLIIFLIVNFLISIITNRYNLLYVPKISFILSINIIIFIFIFNLGYYFGVVPLNLNDVIYFIVFILISEKFINILLSKDLSEYKESFMYTILISLFCFVLLNLSGIRIFILAYPEILVFLIPANFLIGRFTGLRVTEYFRFREVIKNIEE